MPPPAMRSRFKGNIVRVVEKPLLDLNGLPVSREVVDNLMHFTRRQKSGNIDVWWLYDDGGQKIIFFLKKYKDKKMNEHPLKSPR